MPINITTDPKTGQQVVETQVPKEFPKPETGYKPIAFSTGRTLLKGARDLTQELLGNLHWLIHQGHVIEFASGLLETAKKPTAKPEPAAAKPQEPKGDRPRKDRPPRPRGRYVFDNTGLLPMPAAQPALVG